LKTRVKLLPAIADRFGSMFLKAVSMHNSKAYKSDGLILDTEFRVNSPEDKTSGLALWYLK